MSKVGIGRLHVVIFCHSVLSCWNNEHAHFLRGVITELRTRGHHVRVHESRKAWSAASLVRDQGEPALFAARQVYPALAPHRYDPNELDLDAALEGADVVIVHEWSELSLVRRLGEHRARTSRPYVLLFHDTHHRAFTNEGALDAFALDSYDGVLAGNELVREVYARRGWARRAWVWRDAVDVRVFRPLAPVAKTADLVHVDDWSDARRGEDLRAFLLEPARELGLQTTVHGVRYPAFARDLLAAYGATYAGWLPNHRTPEVLARHLVAVHVPRRPEVQAIPGSPASRVLAALACGLPLVSAPWDDPEGLFAPGEDFLVARDGHAMRTALRALHAEPARRRALAARGLATVLARHTCSHRVDELLAVATEALPRLRARARRPPRLPTEPMQPSAR